jgi:hypothetical protein
MSGAHVKRRLTSVLFIFLLLAWLIDKNVYVLAKRERQNLVNIDCTNIIQSRPLAHHVYCLNSCLFDEREVKNEQEQTENSRIKHTNSLDEFEKKCNSMNTNNKDQAASGPYMAKSVRSSYFRSALSKSSNNYYHNMRRSNDENNIGKPELSKQSDEHSAQKKQIHFFDNTARRYKLFNSFKQQTQDEYEPTPIETVYLNVFIFDFELVTSSIIYIDLINYEQLAKKAKQHRIDDNYRFHLIINLVAAQYATFRLFNVPNQKSKSSLIIEKITILLNGDCSLDLIDKVMDGSNSSEERSRKSIIEVLHSPWYAKQNDSGRFDWFNYLNHTFIINNNDNKKNIEYIYMEHLNKFCSISHLRVDLGKLYANVLKSNFGIKNENQSPYLEKFVDYMQLDEHTHLDVSKDFLLNKCKATYESYNSKKNMPISPDTRILHEYDMNDEIYVFEIGYSLDKEKNEKKRKRQENNDIEEEKDDDRANDNYLKLFVKECDPLKRYLLIIYSRKSEKRRLILDDSNCPIKVFVNNSFDISKKFYFS